jgi:homocysteine S-methyltransferase
LLHLSARLGQVTTSRGGISVETVHGPLVTILDGGFATELERRGHDLSDDLWSARLLRDDPDEIVATHLAFFRAGADVATTASYQASVDGFARHGLSRGEAEEFLRDSVRLARIAASLAEAEDGVRRMVAASVGPYGAVLADGSEYHGDYGVSDAFLRDFHRPRMAVLADAGADLLAIETVPSAQEAAALLSVLGEMPPTTRAWLSVSCSDEDVTRRGDDVSSVFSLAASADRVVAVGVNCTAPSHVTELVRRAVAASGKPAVAYPNSGEGWDAATRSWTGSGAVVDAVLAREWVAAGAVYVGGCCRVGSADIGRLVDGLRGQVVDGSP